MTHVDYCTKNYCKRAPWTCIWGGWNLENQPTRSVSNILCFENEDGKIIILFLTLCLYNTGTYLQMVPLVQSSVDSLVEVFDEKVEKGESFEFFRYSTTI